MTEGTVDSGIEFDLSSLIGVDVSLDYEDGCFDGNGSESTTVIPEYHELKSRVVEVASSPRADFRESSMGSRVQLRRNLERQQVLDLEEREKQQAANRTPQQASQNIAMPSIFHAPEVPPKVLQVKTSLHHPTVYHIKQKQQQAAKTYLNDVDDRLLPAHSMPNLALPALEPTWISGSAPTDMDTATNLEDMGLLDEILLEHVENHHDSDLQSIEPSLTQMSSTLPQPSMYAAYGSVEVDSAGATSSSSCPPVFPSQLSPPPNMSEEQQKMWAKDRQKKDNHNMIERRRRFNINDRIKELGTLLPKSYDQDMRQNKGSILKASVDYIRKLRRDSDQLRQEKEHRAQVEKNLQKLQLKFTQMCAVMKQQGASLGLLEETGGDMMVAPSSVINMQHHPPPPEDPLTLPAPTNPHNSFLAFSTLNASDFMEDSSPIGGDPMLTSAPGSPQGDDNAF